MIVENNNNPPKAEYPITKAIVVKYNNKSDKISIIVNEGDYELRQNVEEHMSFLKEKLEELKNFLNTISLYNCTWKINIRYLDVLDDLPAEDINTQLLTIFRDFFQEISPVTTLKLTSNMTYSVLRDLLSIDPPLPVKNLILDMPYRGALPAGLASSLRHLTLVNAALYTLENLNSFSKLTLDIPFNVSNKKNLDMENFTWVASLNNIRGLVLRDCPIPVYTSLTIISNQCPSLKKVSFIGNDTSSTYIKTATSEEGMHEMYRSSYWQQL